MCGVPGCANNFSFADFTANFLTIEFTCKIRKLNDPLVYSIVRIFSFFFKSQSFCRFYRILTFLFYFFSDFFFGLCPDFFLSLCSDFFFIRTT